MNHPRPPDASAGGPESHGNEEDLHRDTEPQACSRLGAKSYTSAFGVVTGEIVEKALSHERKEEVRAFYAGLEGSVQG